MDDLYTAEFSITQKVYHLGNLKQTISENIANVCGNFNTDFVLIGVFKTANDAHEFIEKHKAINPNYKSIDERLEEMSECLCETVEASA